MVKIVTLIAELLILALVFWRGSRFWWRHYGGIKKGIALVLLGCSTLIAISAAMASPTPTRTVTLTGLNEKHADAQETGVYLEAIQVNGFNDGLPEPTAGAWTRVDGRYCWYAPGDKRRDPAQTDTLSFQVPVESNTQLVFLESRWRGKVLIQVDDSQEVVDTFWAGGDKARSQSFALPAPQLSAMARSVLIALGYFALTLALTCAAATLLLELGGKAMEKFSGTALQKGPFRKLAGYEFLFEELVKRDFKKKYKRTVLGMAWSVLSPLLTLLVMRLVFTQFFGRNTAHYTTYLFCGNLVYSYFNESTSQGMTSLVGNSGIFTKVNVPKYLFLLSKNVQTLINFGLTLCVFFVFCVLDNITFTWRLIYLLYPILCLVLFNIGVGLILSALFVFFRDIQYLWSVFTLLLMYMSAIFYTIDGYSPAAQNAFLINPVYLFIRYFRKIVIEATVPSLWFHLLMLADVVIALGLGFWMYKKNNTKFLYYV